MTLFERMLARSSTAKQPDGKINKADKSDSVRPVKHLLVRYNDHLKADGFTDTVTAHMQVIKGKGSVWFGKIGKTIRKDYPAYVKGEKRPVYVFFLKSNRQKCEMYRSRIIDLTMDDVRLSNEKKYVPEYYSQAVHDVGVWIKVDTFEKVSKNDIAKIIVSSSRSPITESLVSTSGTMFVEIVDGK